MTDWSIRIFWALSKHIRKQIFIAFMLHLGPMSVDSLLSSLVSAGVPHWILYGTHCSKVKPNHTKSAREFGRDEMTKRLGKTGKYPQQRRGPIGNTEAREENIPRQFRFIRGTGDARTKLVVSCKFVEICQGDFDLKQGTCNIFFVFS